VDENEKKLGGIFSKKATGRLLTDADKYGVEVDVLVTPGHEIEPRKTVPPNNYFVRIMGESGQIDKLIRAATESEVSTRTT